MDQHALVQHQDFQVAFEEFVFHCNKLLAGECTSIVVNTNNFVLTPYSLLVRNTCKHCRGNASRLMYGQIYACTYCNQEPLSKMSNRLFAWINSEGTICVPAFVGNILNADYAQFDTWVSTIIKHNNGFLFIS